MTKIKYIHCFGTSYTAGGGFEFESPNIQRTSFLKKTYGALNEKLTQFNFSYPGRLQKIIKHKNSNIVVKNHGKQGYGNSRMFRKLYEIVNEYDFNKDEHIFLLEFSDFGRKEFWFNELESFIIFNYEVDWDSGRVKKSNGCAKSWYYDSEFITKKLENLEPYFLDFLDKTFKLDVELKNFEMENEFFISFLDNKNLNYYFTQPPTNYNSSKSILFGDNINFNKVYGCGHFCIENKFTITDETPFGWVDSHNGFIGNELVAKVIFNKLNTDYNLKLEPINIDWGFYKKLDKKKYINKNTNII